jgi:protoporphyrinogen IX oxidase
MTWLKALHIATLLVWCAGLFYLPALFAAHPRTRDRTRFHRLRIMTRFSYIAVASPAAVLAVGSGIALIFVSEALGKWLVVKLTAISLMALYHLYCGWMITRLHKTRIVRRPGFHLAGMIVPASLIPAVFWLVLQKPF